MTEKEDWVCLNKLLKSSVPVLTPSFLSNGESREHIDELSRQVEEDYKNYKDGRCGFFKTSVDQEMHARFQMALLVISYCAKKNGQDLQGASASFSDAELEVCELLKKFVMLDNFSATELRQKLIFGDKSTASFFTGYTLLRELTSHLLGHDEIRSPVRQYLKKQGDLYDEKFETAFGSRGGEFIVTASLARQREFDFISRIEHNLKSGRNCITLSGQSFIVDKIEKGDNAGNLSQKTEPVNERRARPADNLPKNQYLMAVFTEKSLVWRKKSVIFYAICVSHAERYREHGFDSKPLELKEIPAYLDPAVIESCKNYPHAFFCIASPTGFENIGIPGSDNRMLNNFISSGVSVCFWDLHNQKQFFNESDPKSIELGRICDLETTDEKLLKLREILYPEIEQKLLISQSVSLKHCVEFSGMHEYRDPSLAETLFMQYAKEKHLTVKNIPPMGPVIVIQT